MTIFDHVHETVHVSFRDRISQKMQVFYCKLDFEENIKVRIAEGREIGDPGADGRKEGFGRRGLLGCFQVQGP